MQAGKFDIAGNIVAELSVVTTVVDAGANLKKSK